MNVSATSNASSGTSQTSGLTGATGDMFLQLLTTQIKSQDPLSPMDPTQFVGQLVQFNTLGEIMKIRELLAAQPTNPINTSPDGTKGGL